MFTDGMPYVETILYFTGVDFTPQFTDRTSSVFQYYADRFCKDVGDQCYPTVLISKQFDLLFSLFIQLRRVLNDF